MISKNTKLYELEIGQCESKEEYEKLVREHQAYYVPWREHIGVLLEQSRLSYRKIAEGCGVSLSCARTFSKKIPAKRENVIMLAMMMHLSVEETNKLLTRWAKFQKLYPRNPSDAIWIYLLARGGSPQPKIQFQKHYNVFLELREEYRSQPHHRLMKTQIAFDEIMELANHPQPADGDKIDPGFRKKMLDMMPSFENGYRKLLDHINSCFYDPEREDNLRLGLPETAAGKRNTPNIWFAADKPWKEAYYRKIRELEKKGIMPDRAFLIVLGVRLSMNVDQINYLLELAGMGPLCPKDRLEGTMVFYLEDLNCSFPSYFGPLSMSPASGEFGLIDYSSDYEKDSQSVFKVPGIAMDFEENPVEQLNDYIKRCVLETDVFEFGYDDYFMELVNML